MNASCGSPHLYHGNKANAYAKLRLWRIVQENWRILKDTSCLGDYRVYR
jgi:hypothetical protein